MGGMFWCCDHADFPPVLIEEVDAPARGSVEISVGIDAHSVAADIDFEERFPKHPFLHHRKGPDLPDLPGIGDVDPFSSGENAIPFGMSCPL